MTQGRIFEIQSKRHGTRTFPFCRPDGIAGVSSGVIACIGSATQYFQDEN